MPRNRKAVRERKRREAMLDKKNCYGNNDPTPRAAVKSIIKQEQKATRIA